MIYNNNEYSIDYIDILTNPAEPEISSFLFHSFLVLVETWSLHYPQCNLTVNFSVWWIKLVKFSFKNYSMKGLDQYFGKKWANFFLPSVREDWNQSCLLAEYEARVMRQPRLRQLSTLWTHRLNHITASQPFEYTS